MDLLIHRCVLAQHHPELILRVLFFLGSMLPASALSLPGLVPSFDVAARCSSKISCLSHDNEGISRPRGRERERACACSSAARRSIPPQHICLSLRTRKMKKETPPRGSIFWSALALLILAPPACSRDIGGVQEGIGAMQRPRLLSESRQNLSSAPQELLLLQLSFTRPPLSASSVSLLAIILIKVALVNVRSRLSCEPPCRRQRCRRHRERERESRRFC